MPLDEWSESKDTLDLFAHESACQAGTQLLYPAGVTAGTPRR